jgi:hypothetical protein
MAKANKKRDMQVPGIQFRKNLFLVFEMAKKMRSGTVAIYTYTAIIQCNEKYQPQIIPIARGSNSLKKGMFFQMGIMGKMLMELRYKPRLKWQKIFLTD